jgi:UDP-2,3-diacylglucosamine hydrolase
MTKKIYKNRLAQFLFRLLHPDIGIKLAGMLSKNSRAAGGKSGGAFKSNQEENLYMYCVDFLKTDYSIDCFIFGHRHIPLDLELPKNSERAIPSRYINIGDWITHYSSAKLIGGKLTLSK